MCDIQKIETFDLTQLKPRDRMQIIAASGSGKSFLARDIIKHFHDSKQIGNYVVISPNEKLNKFYQQFMPKTYIYNDFDETYIHQLLQRQRKIFQDVDDGVFEGTEADKHVLFIMDDCQSSAKRWANTEIMKKLLMEGRHLNITFMLILQYSVGIGPDLRSQFTHAFVLGHFSENNREKVRNEYMDVIPKKESASYFQQLLQKHGVMVCIIQLPTPEVHEKIKYYKARDLSNEEFFVGSDQYQSMKSPYYIDIYQNYNREIHSIQGKKQKNNIMIEVVGDNVQNSQSGTVNNKTKTFREEENKVLLFNLNQRVSQQKQTINVIIDSINKFKTKCNELFQQHHHYNKQRQDDLKNRVRTLESTVDKQDQQINDLTKKYEKQQSHLDDLITLIAEMDKAKVQEDKTLSIDIDLDEQEIKQKLYTEVLNDKQ